MRTVALILGKEENTAFNRFTFPVLNRPVAKYTILAASHASKINEVYLSSDSAGLLKIGEDAKTVKIIRRISGSAATLTKEIKIAVGQIKSLSGSYPDCITILLANSPCITNDMIDNAVTFLEEHPQFDSVVTAMNRIEFSPNRLFHFDNKNQFKLVPWREDVDRSAYFLDRRVMCIKVNTILGSKNDSDYFESILGENIHPMIQQEGIWDIDYIWQVPLVERWLKQNGFTEYGTPYKNNSEVRIESLQEGKTHRAHVSNVKKILVTTVPFGEFDSTPVKLLENNEKVNFIINPLGRKLREDELAEMVSDYDILIAGTEPITRKVMLNGKRLKLISRVGIGLDSVDLKAAREMGISVSYTPDAPSPAVAELTIAHMLNLLRKLPLVDRKIRSAIWQRYTGRRIMLSTIGIIGTGRVGSRVLKHLQGFSPHKIYVNDLNPDQNMYDMYHAEFVDKETIYNESDILTFHIPLTSRTKNLITQKEFALMKKNVLLINTSRGGIINERDLCSVLENKSIGGAAIDVFENEPYDGKLIELDNCVLSCHMGSMTQDCRASMEIQATEEAIRFVNGEQLTQLVPEEEYINCR
jgi:D-3-phosphoglycerate dehydrogenase / 2-oxoglutarate reductase